MVVPRIDTEALAGLVETTGTRPSMTVQAPATDEPLGTVPECAPADVRAAVERGREAQSAWATRDLDDRIAVLRAVHDAVLDRRAELVAVLQAETGKSRSDAVEEVLDIANTARYYADRAGSFLSPTSRSGAVPLLTRAVEHRHPKGVAGLITPWNYPLTLGVSDALPALVAGNAVVLKPAESTPFTALSAARVLQHAGVPERCFQVVTGEGATLGEPLIEAVDALTFTGSTETGRVVGEQAGRHLTEATLELGGKNPALVLADADTEAAADGAVADCFANAGQLCIAIERIYVEQPAFEAFRDAFVARTRGLELGVGTDWEVDVGSLQSAAQLEKTRRHVADAANRGADVLTGGRYRPDLGPFVYEPTVLTGVPPDAAMTDEETFGPVVRIESVADADTAVSRANDSRYGLHAAVWSGDRTRGEAVAGRIQAGTVSVNDTYRTMWGSADAPMGGRGDSGIGRRHGRQGIEKYVDTQSVVVQRGMPFKHPAVPDRVWAGMIAAYSRMRNTLSRWWP